MTARLLDGKALAEQIKRELAERVRDLTARLGRPPGLAAVLVGDNPASQVYVRNKRKACSEIGLASWLHELPANISQEALLRLIDMLNRQADVDGILIQLPLPRQIDVLTVMRAVEPRKDVDGFGPENLGLLALGQPRYCPCTPLGVQQLLVRNGIDIEGRHVVILGRSNIVGKPLALMLMQKAPGANATVTICHSQSRNLPELCRQADILIAAMGQARFVQADWVRSGAVVVDVGINRLPDGKLCGDVDFEAVRERASAITPVPGGVGPMTIAMLLQNTVSSAASLL
ncbi:MAG: bifunctional methylenetetrahydrofolate dehydrogenase/methenyltetrahydrofolate cyclohydrolase FolD [Gemmatales bacterium]|nr:bifunctional methylenetetrahydrofolate dehydrogenase/methenyltetrahydrofolate cyclohydrolase FolD [Gemmatales bacterium]MDW8387394.1 bifunctional methylenetetrahydrofolate dehydrogenase/methenyltetrahydrofolate cyclohydrolase FolD [Gemmatales bacterium]